MSVPKEFRERFEKFSKFMVENNFLSLEEVEELKDAIRTDAIEGPDQVRDPPYAIDTRAERLEHWSRYFDWWLPLPNGINERIRKSIQEGKSHD